MYQLYYKHIYTNTQEHKISTSHVSLKLKSNILFDSCVATQEIWSVVLCIVLDKVTHTMKFDTQTHKKHVCVCICVTLRNSVTRYPISSRFDLHGIVRENRRNRHNYFQPPDGVAGTRVDCRYEYR